ncbi:hypothetical protein PSSHI_13290 [Photobacterium sp. R1]
MHQPGGCRDRNHQSQDLQQSAFQRQEQEDNQREVFERVKAENALQEESDFNDEIDIPPTQPLQGLSSLGSDLGRHVRLLFVGFVSLVQSSVNA